MILSNQFSPAQLIQKKVGIYLQWFPIPTSTQLLETRDDTPAGRKTLLSPKLIA